MRFFKEYLDAISGNLFILLVLGCVFADTVFGCLRAAKYRKWNSSLGIDGGIRKVGMLFSVAFLALVDQFVGINLIEWLPDNVLTVLSGVAITHVGMAEFFCILYIMYEATSILKNMLLCGLPLHAGLKEKAAKWLDSMTEESNVVIADEVALAAMGSGIGQVRTRRQNAKAAQEKEDESAGIG